MNLLIVDDEPIIRIGLRTLVDWEEHGLRLIGEAADGREALEQIEGGDVDILVTDIRMPRMDGLELIRCARRVKDDLGVLVLSCLDDFSFVKEAMKLGASDYILKPTMEPEELVTILLGMKSDIMEKRSEKLRLSEWQTQVEQSRQYRLSQRTARFIESGVPDPSLQQELFPGGRRLFSVCAFHDAGWSWLDAGLETLGLLTGVPLQDSATLLLFVANAVLSQRDDFEQRYRIAEQVTVLLDEAAGERPEGADEVRAVDGFLSLGFTVKQVEELQALTALHERHRYARFYGKPDRIVWEGGADVPANVVLPVEIRNDLLKSLAHHNIDGLLHHVELLCQSITGAKPPLPKLQTFLYELLVMAAGFARENGYLQTDAFEQRYVSLGRLQSFFHVDPLCRFVHDAVRFLWSSQFGSAAEPVSGNPFIRRALRYMKENYSRNIGTIDIADAVKLSRSYLSDLYSREMGESLIETLTRIRIDEAKKLLASGSQKIYEIAEQVGFSDPKSFAKTFKRIVGSTPKEYESQLR